ncbi:MAG: 50S ribosomal protein L6 [Candidatus Aureabacteria bacterium]|nr:50S ribosomal protein L6 [Candidatus Auribacterota bacterium]NLW93334.1 50S ribosomal protein L6 [Chlamydiota bacterium]HOE27585.1 50S ribosomal protein L6 [bacterium]HQM51809.1 50S ribosomal protein L6 [bacterium]
MSRVGKKPIDLPPKVQVAFAGRSVTVKGPEGELALKLPDGISAAVEGTQVKVACAPGAKNGSALHGVTRTLISNMVRGVSKPYEKTLQIVGVGYKAKIEGRRLVLQLGFSHPIDYEFPETIRITLGKENMLTVTGCDKQAVGQVAAEIRGFYPPEPYKGKGIRYKDERVRRKAGKAVATTS